MSADRLDRVLDAAYTCFTRYGVRRTTMDDIATAAGMSRPAVYQHVRNKEDAFHRLAERLFTRALAEAGRAARAPGSLPEQLDGILAAKLDLTLRLWRDSPHAAELLSAGGVTAPARDFTAAIGELVARTVTGTAVADPAEFAELALALTRGLEADPTAQHAPRARLRRGIDWLLTGATGTSAAPAPADTPPGNPPGNLPGNLPSAAAGKPPHTPPPTPHGS